MKRLVNKISSGEFNGSFSLINAINLYIIILYSAINADQIQHLDGGPYSMVMGILVGPLVCLISIPIVYNLLIKLKKEERNSYIAIFSCVQFALILLFILLFTVYGITWLG